MLLLKSVKSVSNSDDWINIWIGDWCLNAFNCTSARLVVFLICCAQVQLDEIQTDSLSPPLKAHALHLSVKVWFVHGLHDVNPHFESETKQYHCSFFPSENIFINSIKSNERIFFIHAFREVQQHKMNDFIRIKTLRVVFLLLFTCPYVVTRFVFSCCKCNDNRFSTSFRLRQWSFRKSNARFKFTFTVALMSTAF